jgi:hypothetical protein
VGSPGFPDTFLGFSDTFLDFPDTFLAFLTLFLAFLTLFLAFLTLFMTFLTLFMTFLTIFLTFLTIFLAFLTLFPAFLILFLAFLQMRGNPTDTQIYCKATYLQDSGLEAHLVNFEYLISYLDRGSIIKRLKTALKCSMSSSCLSSQRLEVVINNGTFSDNCLQLHR